MLGKTNCERITLFCCENEIVSKCSGLSPQLGCFALGPSAQLGNLVNGERADTVLSIQHWQMSLHSEFDTRERKKEKKKEKKTKRKKKEQILKIYNNPKLDFLTDV